MLMVATLLLAAGAPVASAAASPAPTTVVPAEIDRHYLAAAPARAPAIYTTEVHHWIRIDGTWRRDAATLHFLAN